MDVEEGANMSWALVASIVVVTAIGVVVLRRGRSRPSRGFPWFWVTFPTAVLALVSTVGVFLSRYAGVDIPEADTVGLSQPSPNFNEAVPFLSGEQFRAMAGPVNATLYLWFFPVLALALIVASVVAWRKGRL